MGLIHKNDDQETKTGTDVDLPAPRLRQAGWEGEPAFAKPSAGQAGLKPLIDEQKAKA